MLPRTEPPRTRLGQGQGPPKTGRRARLHDLCAALASSLTAQTRVDVPVIERAAGPTGSGSLDEFVTVSAYHRKRAIRVLGRGETRPPSDGSAPPVMALRFETWWCCGRRCPLLLETPVPLIPRLAAGA